MSKLKLSSAEQKFTILREQLESNQPVSDMCEKYHIHPNRFYHWRRMFFDKRATVFSSK